MGEAGEEKALMEKYRIQLEYYGQALEWMTGMRVKEKYLYSFGLAGRWPFRWGKKGCGRL